MIKISKKKLIPYICLTMISISIFFGSECTLFNPGPVVDNSKAIIVTVDGLSFVNTLLEANIQKSDDYLQTNLAKLINSDSIRPFQWSSNAEDTAELLASSNSGLRKFLIDNYNEAKTNHKAFIVISHSWGTFLTYLALSLEPQIECDLYITLSCPLGTTAGLPDSPEKIVRDYTDGKLSAMSFNMLGASYPNAKIFYNFWAHGDLISGSLTGKIPSAPNLFDVQIDNGISDNRYVTDCYFWHKYTTLGDEVVNSSDPSYSVYTAYLLSMGIINITPTRDAFIAQVVSLIQIASGY